VEEAVSRGRSAALCAGALVLAGASGVARAGTFGPEGEYVPDPAAIAHLDFEETPERWLPVGSDPKCRALGFTHVERDDALDGPGVVDLKVASGCSERFMVFLPHVRGSYRATVWMRHGSLNAQMVALYQDASGLAPTVAKMLPTGRTTSDGWVELASNDFPVDGPSLEHAYLRVADYASTDGVELDALEVVPSGEFVAAATCAGHADPSCGPERQCEWGQCVLPRLTFPPLPSDELRGPVVDVLESRLRLFFGGQRTRADDLPTALATLETMRTAPTATAFWNAWGLGMRRLHDWHTHADAGVGSGIAPAHRLNACFFEGDADRSQGTWPKDPRYADILVSHAGQGSGGLAAGDRVVAIDGLHPIDWARSLIDVYWGFWQACDPAVFAELAERLGGPTWGGGALVVRYATTITVIHCNAANGTCDDVPTTIRVADLPNDPGGPDVYCDNRPFYHLADGKGPDPANHYGLWWTVFRGRIEGTTQDEAIFGMAWDSLMGNGDPNGYINTQISAAVADFEANARGVILDHRAGNGGTLDAASNLTRLVRPGEAIAVVRMPMEIGGFDGPADADAGVAIFDKWKTESGYLVGDAAFAPDLPVALILHRDGSASDYMPFGMKGGPKVRLFGPHATAGGFSTFIQFDYWQALAFQFASGDTIAFDGRALIGHGVEPDEIVLPKQSDLLAGKDTLHEAALAWVRANLKGAK
jgi:hypothetical protein